MAVSTVTLNVYAGEKGFNPLPRKREFIGLAVISTGTYVTGGLPFTWAMLDAMGNAILMPRATSPDYGSFYSITNSGNTYVFNTLTGTLRINAAGTELANGATVPAGVTGDTIEFKGSFQKFQL